METDLIRRHHTCDFREHVSRNLRQFDVDRRSIASRSRFRDFHSPRTTGYFCTCRVWRGNSMSREIEPVRSFFRRRRSCTFTEVTPLVPSGLKNPGREIREPPTLSGGKLPLKDKAARRNRFGGFES